MAAEDSSPWVRNAAIESLGEIGHRHAIPVLKELLTTQTHNMPIISALSIIKDPAAEELIFNALKHEVSQYRARAIDGVVMGDFRPAIPRLIEMLTVDGFVSRANDGGPISTVADDAFRALGRMKATAAIPARN